jgi:hypothetical protein
VEILNLRGLVQIPPLQPLMRAERLIPLLRVQGAAGMKSRRGSSRAAQIDARRVQHTAVIHMAQ